MLTGEVKAGIFNAFFTIFRLPGRQGEGSRYVWFYYFICILLFYIFYYFSRAFGTVSHSILNKMSSLQRDMYIILWVNIWLKGQAQKVIVNWVTSGWQLAISGVPQGLILGPFLFSVFINNLDLVRLQMIVNLEEPLIALRAERPYREILIG